MSESSEIGASAKRQVGKPSRMKIPQLIALVLAIICFADAALAVRDAASWAWLIPAGLAGFAASHLP